MTETDVSTELPSALRKLDPKTSEAITTLLQSQKHGLNSDIQIDVKFEGLNVFAPRQLQSRVKTLPKAILNTFGVDQYNFIKSILIPKLWSVEKEYEKSKTILTDISGHVNPGEMLFVLGRPGSGCSTFLRTIANSTALSVSGDVSYANIPQKRFSREHPRETIYLPEEDRHIAALTVQQTIQFALRTTLPASIRTPALVHELVSGIAKLLGLEHTLESPVGGQFFPGVSGGERKRVSIAEVFAAGSSIQCFDNSTMGLDSSTALDFVRALRSFTDIGKKTTLATLYQAGENIWNHFDKVLLLAEGQEIFFGPTTVARQYFEALGFIPLPGQTSAEFLLAATDISQRLVTPGSIAESLVNPTLLAAQFRKSTEYENLKNELRISHEVHHNQSLQTDTYNLNFPKQVWECLRREYQLAKGQSRVYHIKWLTTVILCLVCGSVYWDIENNAQGAFTRGGILFFALIFNGWLQFPELFDAHTNRPVLERQARIHLNRASAVAVARFLIDLPLIAFQHVIFILPFYFLSRLQVDVGKFFFFYLTLLLSTVSFSNLLRLFPYYVGTLDDCFRYGGFACTVNLLFAGFLIPAQEMAPAFGWLHWINPMYYAFENLFTNEFSGLNLQCASPVPNVAGISEAFQSCAIRGAKPGKLSIDGAEYTNAYGFLLSHRWRNIGVLILISIVYLLVGIFGSEVMTFTAGSPTITFVTHKQKKKKDDSAVYNDVEKSAMSSTSEMTSSEVHKSKKQRELAFTCTDVNVQIGDKEILRGISFYVRRGELTALCGASGAGKTTLLSSLSQVNFHGQLSGEVLVGNSAPGIGFRKTIGFAQQMDLHDGTATVREALEFSALLRQPSTYSTSEKLAYVERVLEILDLLPIADAIIGTAGSGLSIEQLKRVTIGVEVASRPQILFADEPTSGLDSQSAAHIIHYLKTLARQGQAIIVTIHQPSALLFSQFDNVLVLSSEGQQLYFGSEKASLKYFEQQGAICPEGENPAEFILHTIGAGVSARTENQGANWSDKWKASPESEAILREIEDNKRLPRNSNPTQDDPAEFNTSTWTQTRLLTLRMLRNQWRNPPYIYSKIWVHVISGVLVGLTFYNLGTSPEDLQNRAFSVYFILFLCNAIVNVILARFFFAGLYWAFREGPSRTYGWFALCSASILAELPAAVLVTVLYFVLWYFPSGLPLAEAGYIFLFLLTYEVFQVLLGLFMMALSPDLGFAGNVLVFIICTFNWFNGIIVPYSQIQVFWRYWLYYLSPFTYLLGGMITAVISGVEVTCSPASLTHFDAPPNTTCGDYAASWAKSASVQLLNPDATNNCEVCRYTTGDQFLAEFNLGPGQLVGKWGSWGIFVLFTLTNLVLVYFFTWATKVKRWKLFYFF